MNQISTLRQAQWPLRLSTAFDRKTPSRRPDSAGPRDPADMNAETEIARARPPLPHRPHDLQAQPCSFATTRSVHWVESVGLATMVAYFVCGLAAVLFN